MDVRRPIKREKRVKRPGGNTEICKLRYEKLPTFCYICGLMGHVERNCQIRFNSPDSDIPRLWGPELRAPPRINKPRGGERWLIEEEEVNIVGKVGDEGEKSGEQRGVKGRVTQKLTLAPNIQQLSANWGVCPNDEERNVVDREEVRRMEVEEMVVGAEKKRRREGKDGVGSSAVMEMEGILVSPTKKNTQGI
ncbi:hypothetical protein LINPERHAP1_LOCUS1999 [Linum perenne]